MRMRGGGEGGGGEGGEGRKGGTVKVMEDVSLDVVMKSHAPKVQYTVPSDRPQMSQTTFCVLFTCENRDTSLYCGFDANGRPP